MNRLLALVVLGGGLTGLPLSAVGQDTTSLYAESDQSSWTIDLTSGYDATLHSYTLATDDTTETISEFMVQAGVRGRSARAASHRWRVRGEASTGTELWRQRLDGDYRWLDAAGATRVRLMGRFWGRQYRNDTSYSRSSDNWEGTLEGRLSPWTAPTAAVDLRAWGGVIDYRTPSTLEVDYRDKGVGLFARSRGSFTRSWSVGSKMTARAYPDSAAIDRDTWSLEGDFESQDLEQRGLRLYHKSARRTIADETARPSAWTHWTEVRGTVGAGTGRILLEVQNEVWSYDNETGAYYDSWRTETRLGYRWGDLLTATWQTGVTFERMDAGDSPETYTQYGVRGGVDSYGSVISGQLTLEYGRRVYEQGSVSVAADPSVDPAADSILLYSDFNYFKIWLMAGWVISPHFNLDVMASYEPENHTERSDDASIGYASARLVWRP